MFAIRAPHAFDGERFLAGGATVLVEGGLIAGVEPAGHEVPAGCPVTEHPDATVLPGLVDTHVHLVGDSGPLALERVAGFSAAELDAVVTEGLRRHLAAGVTTVRDLGDRDFNVVERRDAQRAHDDGLPWILASGPPVTSPRGHCHFLGGEVAGREAIEAAVRERVERRVDVLKVMASGGMTTTGTDVTTPQFGLDDLRLLVDAAHRAGLPVTAHAHAAAAVDQVLAAGVQGIEHASYLRDGGASLGDVDASDEQLAELAASGVDVCPTLGGFTAELLRSAPPQVQEMVRRSGMTPEQIVERRASLLGRMHASGVRLVSGADAGIGPAKAHGDYATAVSALADVVGLGRALAAATSLAAWSCGLGGSKGRLRRGYDADVLVVAGDLSAGVGALADVREVVLRGSRVRHAADGFAARP